MLDVIVIGAGMAGLSATRFLRDAGYRVICLEARDRLGGRAHSVTLANGARIDRGCAWLHSADKNPLVGIARRLGFHVDEYNSRYSEPWARTYLGNELFEDWRRDRDSIWDAIPGATDWEEDRPLASLYPEGTTWKPIIDAVFTYIWGVNPSEISAKSAALDGDTGVNWRLPMGYGSVVARFGEGLPVITEAPVSRIALTREGVRVESAKGILEARSAVIAVPVGVLQAGAIAFDPLLPERKAWALEGLAMGSNNKVHLAVTGTPTWEGSDFHAFFRTDSEETATYQFQAFGEPVVEGYFGGTTSRELAKAGAAAQGAFAIDEIASHFGNGVRRNLSFLHATAWDLDPWSLGGYSYARVGYAAAREALAEPLEGRLFFAGEASTPTFAATCHGAYLTGERAAAEIGAALGH